MPPVFRLTAASDERPNAASDRTRARLLQKALRLFAQEGLKGVSLRRIVSAAGAANPSALHYHFGDRWALVTAIAGQVFSRLREASLPRLQELSTRPHTLREVLEAVFMPVVELREQGADGRDAVRFLARLSWEFGTEGQALSGAGLHEIADAALKLLRPLLPHKAPDHLRLHLLMAMTNVFHGVADYGYLKTAPFGPHGLLGERERKLRLGLFFDYLEGGMAA